MLEVLVEEQEAMLLEEQEPLEHLDKAILVVVHLGLVHIRLLVGVVLVVLEMVVMVFRQELVSAV